MKMKTMIPVATAAFLLATPLTAQQPGSIAIVGASVLPMTGPSPSVLADWTVLVRDGRIERIGPTAEIGVPVDAARIDGSGLFVIPGLVDAHYHLYEPLDLGVLLAHGVTTILNQSGAPFHLDLRRAIEAGEIVGPTLYTTGPQLKDVAHPAIDTERNVATVEDARRLVATHARLGYDFVKPWSGFSSEIYAAITAEARRQGIRVLGHVPRSVGLAGVAAEGQSIAHVEEFFTKHFARRLNDAGIAEAVGIVAKSDVAVVTTLITYEMIARTIEDDLGGLLERPGRRFVDPVRQLMWEPEYNQYRARTFLERGSEFYREALGFKQRISAALEQAGVRLLAGTDAGFLPGIVPGEDLHRELELLVEAGLSPHAALVAATAAPGAFLEPDEPFGTIEPGARADLVLLDANPLEGIDNVRRVRGVVSRGRYYSRPDLDEMLEQVAEANERTDGFVQLVMTGGTEAAADYLDSLRNSGPTTVSPFEPMPAVFLAYALGNQGDLEGAIGVVRLTSAVYPDHDMAVSMLAGLLLATGDDDGARTAYERLLVIRPGHPEAERMLAILQQAAERLK